VKIMVCLKQVPNQDARLDIRPDGTWIQEDNLKFEINTYDTYALEEALRAKDAGECEVVAVSIGPDRVTQALRTALGRCGEDSRGRREGREPGPDLHGFHGRRRQLRSRASDARRTPGDPPHLGGPESGPRKRQHETEGGVREVVELQRPCLISVQTGLNQVRYASLKGIMAAKKKPLDVKTIADLGLSGGVGAANAKIAIEKVSMPQKGESAELVTGSVDEMANGLLSKIKELGLL